MTIKTNSVLIHRYIHIYIYLYTYINMYTYTGGKLPLERVLVTDNSALITSDLLYICMYTCMYTYMSKYHKNVCIYILFYI